MPKRPAAPPAFEPFALRDPATVLGGRFGRLLALAPTFKGVRVVERVCLPAGMLGVRDRIIMDAQLPNYPRIPQTEMPLQSLISDLKEEMLLHGATPEAVMLVGAHAPFNEEELKVMANKLNTKGAAKKAPAKAKAAKADNGGTEAKSDDRKIKVVKKEHGAREGTKRADMLNTIYNAKTVQDAVDAGVSKSDVSWAARAGYIELS